MRRLLVATFILALFVSLSAQAQESAFDAAQPGNLPIQGFQMNLLLGSDLLPDQTDNSSMSAWPKIGLQPTYAIGRFSCGLDLSARFIINSSSSSPFSFYKADWVPDEGRSFLDVYLPKILYLRYGSPEEDLFHFGLGPIEDLSLGDGLIVSGYSNTRLLPKTRFSGLQFGLDGSLVNFPYIGVEGMVGNLARADIVAGRAYLRPLAFLDSINLKDLQVGATIAIDRSPLQWVDEADLVSYPQNEMIYVCGADLRTPILKTDPFAISAFADWAIEPNQSQGLAVGFEMKIIRFVNFGAQVRYLQEGFIPAYFNSSYDLYRVERFSYMKNSAPGQFISAWASHLGFSLFRDLVSFDLAMDGRFASIPGVETDNSGNYPHIKANLAFQNDLIEGFALELAYEKYFIGRSGKSFWDLSDLSDARIDLFASYEINGAVLKLNWAYGWNPILDTWDTFTGISATIRFLDKVI
ncbi:MAG: hypothetical protein LLF89_05110 [Spirochaetaceae bacterium]|nr:hypothetical protein [Spirochaetaceae bacterium]